MSPNVIAPRRASAAARSAGPKQRLRRRLLLLILLVATMTVTVSLGRAVTGPGTDSVAARLAEWARGHGLSSIVDQLERATYQPPKVGGAPAANSPLTKRLAAKAAQAQSAGIAPLVPLAAGTLPGEGQWHPLAVVGGRVALQVAYLRPDAVHTSYTAAVTWMDTRLLRFVLHPGTQEPGRGPWPVGPTFSSTERLDLVAAFNGGFRLDAARGGFFEHGRTAGVLRNGAASLVIDGEGRAEVGQWGRDVGPSGKVEAVRQNLDLLVDDRHIVQGLGDNARGRWGKTLGNKLFVWRSGVGQTSSGALVYVAGNRLSASTLAELLRRAGCVRAMELDINPEWTSFVTYPTEKNVLPDMQRSPRRYDTVSTRDFVAVLKRSP